MPFILHDGPYKPEPQTQRPVWSLVLEGLALALFGGLYVRLVLAVAETFR